MEVYATIFIIFVFHVLSSFTQKFSSRHKDGSNIPQSKIGRMFYFKNHSNDKENQWLTASEHVMPFTEGNGVSGSNLQFVANKVARAEMFNVKSQSFLPSRSSKNHLWLPWKKRLSDITTQNIILRTITTEQAFHYPTDNTEVVLKPLDKDEINNSAQVQSSSTQSWANRAKMKFITVRPWNQFCITCDTANEHKVNSFKTYTTHSTKRKKTKKPCFLSVKNTPAINQQWLFYAHFAKTPNPSDKSSTKSTVFEKKTHCTCLNPQRTNHIDNDLNMRRIKRKRNYFLPIMSQLGVIKSSRKRFKNGANKNSLISDIINLSTHKMMGGRINFPEEKVLFPLDEKLFHNSLLSRIHNLKRRSMKLTGYRKNSDLVGFISLRRRDKNRTLVKGVVPSFRKSCFFNLTALVNAQTIKPMNYFERKPTIFLSCQDELSVDYTSTSSTSSTSTTSTSTSKPVTESTTATTVVTDSPIPNKTASSSVTTVSTTPGDWEFGITGSIQDIASDPDNSPIPTALRMYILLEATTTEETTTDRINLKIVFQNKDDLKPSNEVKTESKLGSISKPLYYLISFKGNDTFEENPNVVRVMKKGYLKRIQPWEKFCLGGKQSGNCNVGTDINRQPWVTACLGCMSTPIGVDLSEGDDLNKLPPDSEPLSTEKSRNAGVQIVHKPLEEDDYFEELEKNQTRLDRKPLLFIRVPIAAQDNDKNGSWGLVLPFNNTSNTRHVKPRSIFDIFMPSLIKRPTVNPIEPVVKPCGEPWQFSQEKFSLFTTADSSGFIPVKNNPCTTTNEPPFISKSLFEYIAETCPSCSKKNIESSIKTTEKRYDEIDTIDKLCCEDDGTDNSCDVLSKDKSNLNLLKLPEVDLKKISSPTTKKIKPLRGLTVLESPGSPPKYFIEVSDLSTGLSKIALDASNFSPVSPRKKPNHCPEKLRNVSRKKSIILCLKPFNVNGNTVYLPMSDVDIPDKGQPSTSVYTKTSGHTSFPRRKTIANGFLDKDGSALAFVLIPAYLAMRPHTTRLPRVLDDLYFPHSSYEKRKSLFFGNSGDYNDKIKFRDVELPPLLSNLPIEKKFNQVSKQLRFHNLPSKGEVDYRIGIVNKSPRKSLSGSSPLGSGRPPYVILMNEMNAPFLRI